MNIALLINITTILAKGFDEETIKKLLELYKSIFNRSNFFMDFLHWLGWALVKGLCWVVEACKSLMDIAFETLNFMDFTELTTFSGVIKPIAFTVLTISIGYLAYVYLLASEKPKNIGVNIAMLVISMVLLPWVMSQANALVTGTKDAVMHSDNSSAWTVVQPYVTDLYYLDDKNFYRGKNDKFDLKNKQLNGYSGKETKLEAIDIQEKMDMESGNYDDVTNKDLFKKYLKQDKNGDSILEKIDGSWFADPPWYYRYKVDYLLIYLNLLAIALVYIFSSVKVIMIMFELVTEKMIAPFFASGDLATGQKIKTILTGILNGYITLFVILFLQKLFFLWSNYVAQTTFTDGSFEGFIKAILVLVGALAIIDGPNICEKVLGIDAGLKSVGQSIQSTYHASQMAGSIAKTGVSVASGVANAGGNVVQAGGNAIAGTGGMLSEIIRGQTERQASNNSMMESMVNAFGTEQSVNSSGTEQGVNNSSSEFSSSSHNERATNTPQASKPNTATTPSQGVREGESQSPHASTEASMNSQTPLGGNTDSNNQSTGGIGDYLRNEITQRAGQSQLGQSYNKGREIGKAINNSLNNRNNN